MDWTLIPLWITSVAAAGGVIAALVRNGRSQRKSDIEMKVEIKKDIEAVRNEVGAIQKQLGDPYDGLGAIRREVGGVKEQCARVSSGFEHRISGVENTIRRKSDE